MKYSIVINSLVTKDITEIVEFYKNINPKLALQFLSRLSECNKHIVRSPFGYQIKYKNVRTILLKQFPYHIHYLINKPKNQIVILAVIHSYKKPTDFSNRV